MFIIPEIWEYIQNAREVVHDLEQRLQRTKANIDEIQNTMKIWANPIYDRKEGKKDNLLNLEDKTDRLERIYSQIRSSGEKIHFILKVSCKATFFYSVSSRSPLHDHPLCFFCIFF